MTEYTPDAQSATVPAWALIEQSALALASGNVGDAKYRLADAVDVHRQVYGPLLAAKDAVIQRLRTELADITKTAWEDRESRIKEAGQIRADLAERTRERDERFRSVVHQCCEDVQTLRAELERERNPNVELSLANQAAFSASLAAVQARYADGFKLQRDAARAELAALRAQQVAMVRLPEDWRAQLREDLKVPRYVQAAEWCIESWRPATEPAEATEPEMTGGPQWWRVTCCEAGQVAYLDPCPWHGTEGHPAAPATEPARPPATDYPDGLPERVAKSGCEATTWDRCLLKECYCGGYPGEPRVFRKGDPEPSDINQVKDDGDRRWCRNRADRSWYLRDIAGPFLMWDELLDRTGRLTEVPTDGGQA